MKTKANGITINYQIDGAEGAPWDRALEFAGDDAGDVGRAGRGP